MLQSGQDEKWGADSMECYCYQRNIQHLLFDGKTTWERRFGEPFKGPVIPIVRRLNITLFLPKTCRACISLARKSCQEYSSVTYHTRGESGKETPRSQTWRNWKRLMHLKSILNAKEVLPPQNGEKNIFPIADGTVKLSGGDQVLRTSTLIRDNLD